MDFLIVGLGGLLGAMARYGAYLIEQRSAWFHFFPVATLLINVGGSLLAGILLASIERSLPLHRHLILFSSMGFVGSFTTFSTLAVETFQLMRAQQMVVALASVGVNLVLGMGSVWIGRALMLKLF